MVLLQTYLSCLKEEKQKHHKCRELSKEYLQCRMDSQLMANEDLNQVSVNFSNCLEIQIMKYIFLFLMIYL